MSSVKCEKLNMFFTILIFGVQSASVFGFKCSVFGYSMFGACAVNSVSCIRSVECLLYSLFCACEVCNVWWAVISVFCACALGLSNIG